MSVKDPVKGMKRQARDWEKIFANHIFDKELYLNDIKNSTVSMVKKHQGFPLVAKWFRICLPMQGTWVRGLVREDPTCGGATKAVHHNY